MALDRCLIAQAGNQEIYEKMHVRMFKKACDVELECFENPEFYGKYMKAATQIMITPLGFRFRIVSRIITNFHQPKSTLLLLISAYVGEDWRKMYQFALDNGFRFLSYGDSSLLICDK